MLNIIKGGLRQQVSETSFNSLYKINSWAIDETFVAQTDTKQETIKCLKNQGEIRNYVQMVGSGQRKFDDKIFKSED